MRKIYLAKISRNIIWRYIVLACLFISSPGLSQPLPKITHFGEGKGYNETGPIMDVQTDSKGIIWIVTSTSINRYDGKNFRKIQTENLDLFFLIRWYESISGEKFVVDISNHIYYIEGDSLRPDPLNEVIRSEGGKNFMTGIYKDRGGNIHIGFPGKGYAIIKRDSTVTYPLKNIDFPMHGIVCVYMEDGTPFISHQRNDSLRSAGHSSFYLFDQNLELIDSSRISFTGIRQFPSCTRTSDGRFLTSTGRSNLIEFDENGILNIHKFEDEIISLLGDKIGNIWISTISDGIQFYKRGEITPENKKVIANYAYNIASTQDFQGGIWLYSNKQGLYRISRPEFLLYNAKSGLIETDYINGITLDHDTLYVGESNGNIYQVSPKDSLKKKYYSPPDLFNNFGLLDLHYDTSYQRLWASSRGNVNYMSNGKWRSLHIEKPNQNRQSPYYFFPASKESNASFIIHMKDQYFLVKDTTIIYSSPTIPSNIEWIFMVGDTTYVISYNTIYQIIESKAIDLGDRYSELKKYFTNAVSFKGQIWFASKRKGLFVIGKYGIKEILFGGEAIHRPKLLLRGDNELWCLANSGSLVFTNSDSSNHFTGTVLSAYTPLESMSIRKWINNEESMFWSTNQEGVLRIDFEDMKKLPIIPPRVFIEQVLVNEEDKTKEALDMPLNLEHFQNYVELTFVGINYSDKPVSYRYKLSGVIDDWKETLENHLQFVHLSPGTYDFELQARIGYQPWSKSKKLGFVIAPPYWQTWWFISLSLILMIFSGYKIISLRNKRINREKNLIIGQLSAEQKALRAKMDPHFIFNVISSVQYLILKKQDEKAINFLQTVSKIMRSVLDHSEAKYISLEQELNSLEDYIKMEQMRLEDIFDYRIQCDDDLLKSEEQIIPFVIQPFVENAIHHGLKRKNGKGKLNLAIEVQGEFLKILIEDNGIGRKAAEMSNSGNKKPRKSHGIKIAKERLRLHNLTRNISLEITDLYDDHNNPQGTRVTINVKRIKL